MQFKYVGVVKIEKRKSKGKHRKQENIKIVAVEYYRPAANLAGLFRW